MNEEKKQRKYPKNNCYQENEQYRIRLKKMSLERYHKDPDYRKATLERARNRYHEDEEYQKATIERAKKRYRSLKISKQNKQQSE